MYIKQFYQFALAKLGLNIFICVHFFSPAALSVSCKLCYQSLQTNVNGNSSMTHYQLLAANKKSVTEVRSIAFPFMSLRERQE